MKQFLCLIMILVCLTGCFPSREEKLKTGVEQYYKIQAQKQELSQQYSELMQNPEENTDEIHQLDKQLHTLNLKLKQIVSNPEIRSFLQKETRRNLENRQQRATGIQDHSNRKAKKEKEFDYYTDNTTIEGDIDFVYDELKGDIGGSTFSNNDDTSYIEDDFENSDDNSALDLDFSDVESGIFEEDKTENNKPSGKDLIDDELGAEMNFEYDSNEL